MLRIKTCSSKKLPVEGIREQAKYLVLLSNNQVVIGPEWWAMKEARRTGKPIVDMYPTTVRVNRVITTLNKLLENLEYENNGESDH